MKTIANLIWFIFGGVVMGLCWWGIGLLAYISIVGIPWGRACFVLGNFMFFPFGKEAVSRMELTHKEDLGTGPLGMIGNVIWFFGAGIWLALGHLTATIACFITIIGIPFGIQHLKFIRISLAPIGMTIVPK